MIVDPRTIYSYLLNAGVSTASAAGILANIQAESGFNSSVMGDGNTSGGLFQHHAGRLTSLKSYANGRGQSWTNWQVQVDFALQEARAMGINLNHTDAAQASYEWTVDFEVPANAEQKAQERAANVGAYSYGGDSASTSNYTAGATDSTTGGAVNIPTDGRYVNVDGQVYVTFFAGYGTTGTTLYFKASSVPDGKTASKMTQTDWAEQVGSQGWVNGGSTEAFRGAKGGQTFMQMIEPMLFEAGIMGSEAMSDPSVWRVIGQFLARPDMSPAEFQNRLRETSWWKDTTDRQRQYNDLSPAEQRQQMIDMAGRLSGLWFTYIGQELDVSNISGLVSGYITGGGTRGGGSDDPFIAGARARGRDGGAAPDSQLQKLAQWSFWVASGAKTEQQFINEFLKPIARDTEGSPYWRILAEEEKAGGQHEVDVETMAAEIVDMYHGWGVQMSFNGAKKVAEDVVMNRMSLVEVEQELMNVASGLYPNKPKNVRTMDWAQPYMQTYQQLMEVGETDLFQRNVQNALQQGQSLGDFRSSLKKTGKWMETKNAQEEFSSMAGDLGRMFGF